MAAAFERACVRAMLGCVVLGVAGCHSASREADLPPALSENPAVAMAVVSPVDDAPDNDFAGEGEMQYEAVPFVVRMQSPRLDPASADHDALADCKAWALTREDAEAFFAISRPVDPQTWNEEPDAPCAITGTVHSNGVDWQFSINGANKATWRSGAAVRYLHCDSIECEQFRS